MCVKDVFGYVTHPGQADELGQQDSSLFNREGHDDLCASATQLDRTAHLGSNPVSDEVEPSDGSADFVHSGELTLAPGLGHLSRPLLEVELPIEDVGLLNLSISPLAVDEFSPAEVGENVTFDQTELFGDLLDLEGQDEAVMMSKDGRARYMRIRGYLKGETAPHGSAHTNQSG